MARWFGARELSQAAAAGTPDNSSAAEVDTRKWSAPLDIAAGKNAPQAPLLAAESASGSAAVWYANSPQPGFYLSVQIAETDTWTEPQFLDFTSAADWQPIVALDYQRQLHLVWEHAAKNGTEIRYAAAALDPVNLTIAWREPVTLSNPETSAVNPALAVSDWNAQPRVHVVWLEAETANADVKSWNVVARQASSPASEWSAPLTLGVAPSSLAHPALAATYGQVAVAYTDSSRITYRQCDLAAAQYALLIKEMVDLPPKSKPSMSRGL